MLLSPPSAFRDELFEFGVLDWRSFQLPRVARSSLNAETQAAASAADALEYATTFWGLLGDPTTDLLATELRVRRPSVLAVDAKSLYDALKRESVVSGATCTRSAVQQLVLKQTLQVTGTPIRWVSSERQLADGLTKPAARQLFADRLRSQKYRLVHDSSYTAAKKKSLAERKASEREGLENYVSEIPCGPQMTHDFLGGRTGLLGSCPLPAAH